MRASQLTPPRIWNDPIVPSHWNHGDERITMTRLIEELNTLHASYVDAINTAVADDNVALAAELAADYDHDALLLVADHEGRQDLLPLFGLDRDGDRLSVERDTPLRRLVARLSARHSARHAA
jgi:hypothetical protein